MGLFFRKRIRVAPGVRLNLGTHHVSATVGGNGLGYNVRLAGRGRRSEGIAQASPPPPIAASMGKALAVLGVVLAIAFGFAAYAVPEQRAQAIGFAVFGIVCLLIGRRITRAAQRPTD